MMPRNRRAVIDLPAPDRSAGLLELARVRHGSRRMDGAAELMLDPEVGLRLGDRVLLPGMPVDVFIRTGSHTPLAYLVQPFADYFNRALRENG
jgi:hypothetical protein